MWRVLRNLIAFAVIVAAVVVGGAYALPDRATFERHTVIAVPAADVFPWVGELRNYPKWLPWVEQDPAITYSFEGALVGAGQKIKWSSAVAGLGEGTAESTVVKPGESITLKIDSSRWPPAEMQVRVAPVEGGTGVTWTLSYPASGIFARWRAYFTFEDTTSPDLVAGLAKLKQHAESGKP